MLNKTQITICPIEGISITEGEGVLQTKKFIEMDDLRDIFLTNIQLETGILPKGCLYYLKQDGKTILILEQEPRIRRILLRSGSRVQEYSIATPNIVFGLILEAGTLIHSYCAVSKMPIVSNESELYRFPLGNVYTDSRICWGNANLEPIRNIAHATEIPNIFFEAPFNGDLYSDANNSGLNIQDYYTSLNGSANFPINHLRENGIRTLGDLIMHCKRQIGLV